MNVGQLRAILSTLPSGLKILTDMDSYNNLQNKFVGPPYSMNEPTYVSKGIVWEILLENGTTINIEAKAWENYNWGLPNSGEPALYIGNGRSITSNIWQKLN